MRGVCGPLLLSSLLTLPILFGLPVTAESGVTTWSWSIDPEYDGPVAIQLHIDGGSGNVCRLDTEVMHVRHEDGMRWREILAGDKSATDWRPYRSVTRSDLTGDNETVMWDPYDPPAWETHHWWQRTLGSRTYTYIAARVGDADPSDGLQSPFRISIECSKPFTLSNLRGSTEAEGFLLDTMQGGTVVTNREQIVPDSTLSLLGRRHMLFEEGPVHFWFLNAAVNGGAAAGVLSAENADGARSWVLANTQGVASTQIHAQGPSGPWTIGLDRIGTARIDVAVGFVYALPPIASFDALNA